MLLTPVDHPVLGRLNSRVAMSAMTRGFASDDHHGNSSIGSYYTRRAAAGVGLILSEGIIVHPSADGYVNVPRLHTNAQADSWRPILEPVHAYGAKMFAQLWHCGRISHPEFTEGIQPVSSTNIAATGINRQNNKPYGEPRALEIAEFPEIYEHFVHSAKLALDAGFDGVELHMGHGYLVDQFFDARINDRQDAYGSANIENRCRFGLGLLRAVVEAIGSNCVMVRISPSRMMGGLYEWDDMMPMLAYLLNAFDQSGLKILDVSCANADYYQTSGKVIRAIRPMWRHTLIGGASLSLEQAETEVAESRLDLVTWGRALIANPDLVSKFRDGRPILAFNDRMRDQLI